MQPRALDIRRPAPDAGPPPPEPRCPSSCRSPTSTRCSSPSALFGLELAIRWYALAYIAGLLLGWRYVACALPRGRRSGAARAPMRPEQADDLLTWMILGVILGGRLGYVLFYQPALLRREPGRDPRGLAGRHVVPRRPARGRRRRDRLLPAQRPADPAASATRWRRRRRSGIFFGRLANFINAELWGRPSTAPWAVVFPGEAAQTCPPDWTGALRPPPLAALRGGARGARALRSLLALAIRARRARAAGPGLRAVPGRLRAGAAGRRAVPPGRRPVRDAPATRTATSLRLGAELGPDHGPAPVAADARRRPRPAPARGAARRDPARRPDPRARIAAEGPMRLDAYMALCLGHPEHGYYATRDPLRRRRRLRHRARDQPDVRRAHRRLGGAGLGATRARPTASCWPSSAPAAAR